MNWCPEAKRQSKALYRWFREKRMEGKKTVPAVAQAVGMNKAYLNRLEQGVLDVVVEPEAVMAWARAVGAREAEVMERAPVVAAGLVAKRPELWGRAAGLVLTGEEERVESGERV